MSEEPQGRHADEEEAPDDRNIAKRSNLLPEEKAVGSDDPKAQAEAVLADSLERTEHPDPDSSTQSPRRTSEEATPDTP